MKEWFLYFGYTILLILIALCIAALLILAVVVLVEATKQIPSEIGQVIAIGSFILISSSAVVATLIYIEEKSDNNS
jgi:hypothetical protein